MSQLQWPGPAALWHMEFALPNQGLNPLLHTGRQNFNPGPQRKSQEFWIKSWTTYSSNLWQKLYVHWNMLLYFNLLLCLYMMVKVFEERKYFYYSFLEYQFKFHTTVAFNSVGILHRGIHRIKYEDNTCCIMYLWT